MGNNVTNEDIIQFEPMVESFMRKSVVKNWNEANQSSSQDEVALGNSGFTMADIRQHLRTEVFIALRNYKPEYNTKVSTFVYGHLTKRIGTLMKKLTKEGMGYGKWSSNLEEVLREIDVE